MTGPSFIPRWGAGRTAEAQPAIPSAEEPPLNTGNGGEPEPSPPTPEPFPMPPRFNPRTAAEQERIYAEYQQPIGTLCEQIADALDGIALAPLAKQAKVSVNTLVRAKAGEGIRLETLEKIATVLGWTVTISDASKVLVRYQAPHATEQAASASQNRAASD